MQFSVVRPHDLGDVQLARWRDLQARTETLRNPFLAPEFTLAVGRFRTDARVAVLSDGGTEVGFFPFERGGMGIGRPVAAGLTYSQGLVHAPGCEWEPQRLLRACDLSVWTFDHLTAGQEPFERSVTGRFPSPVIDLSKGYDAYLAELRQRSSSFVKGLRRKERNLERDAGPVRFEFADDRPDALRALMAWKSAQFRRTGRPDKFARSWITGLLEHLHAERGEGFATTLSVLYAGDRPVAANFDLRSGPVLAGWFSAYDPGFARYSPGLIVHLRQAEAAAGHGVRYVDQGRGPAEYKESLKSFDWTVAEGRVARPSAGAGLHWLAHAPVRSAHNLVVGSRLLRAAAVRGLKWYGLARTWVSSRPASSGARGPHRGA